MKKDVNYTCTKVSFCESSGCRFSHHVCSAAKTRNETDVLAAKKAIKDWRDEIKRLLEEEKRKDEEWRQEEKRRREPRRETIYCTDSRCRFSHHVCGMAFYANGWGVL
ncbi:MAG: hypothetical protein AAB611_01990 [Patescibacteria group bacterium]